MAQSEIKYRFAKNLEGEIIDIHTLIGRERNKRKYLCLCCEVEMITRIGSKRTAHFSHKKNDTCTKESYLHILGKKLFLDTFNECKKKQSPFFIELYQKRVCTHFHRDTKTSCPIGKDTVKLNLIEYYDKIDLEKKEGAFIPDLKLTSKSGEEKLLIEIAVSHFSSDEKLSSDFKIIEIEVNDEADLEPIKNGSLSTTNPKIKFYKFDTKVHSGSICDGVCENEFVFFTTRRDGRSQLRPLNLNGITNELRSERDDIATYSIIPDLGYRYPDIYRSLVIQSILKNENLKNCIVCSGHEEANRWIHMHELSPIYCNIRQVKCNANEAASCQFFNIDEQIVKRLKNTADDLLTKIDQGIAPPNEKK